MRGFGAKRRWSGALAALATATVAAEAHAYRPFDGTDADVAEEGEFELELGPAHLYREGEHHYLIAPATVLNFGLVRNLELVGDFRGFVGLERVPDEPRLRLLDTDVLLKWVLRRGALQDESGPSIAIEAGPLVPELGGEKTFGAQADVITSFRWSGGTLHLNEQGGLARSGNAALFSSAILEGPHELVVRPVGEIFVEHELGENITTVSWLVGAIWTTSESFTLDAALRVARAGDAPVQEARLGFTWAVPVFSRKPEGGAENASVHWPHGARR